MPSQKEYDNLYMDIAHRIAAMSKAERLKVGCVIVKDDRIISYGYNGTNAGESNVCEHEGITKPDVVHAEINALRKLALSPESIKGATVYLTHSPCMTCAATLAECHLESLLYDIEYRIIDGVDHLKKFTTVINIHK